MDKSPITIWPRDEAGLDAALDVAPPDPTDYLHARDARGDDEG